MRPAVLLPLLLLGSLALLTPADSTEPDVQKLLAAGSAVGTFVFDRAAFDKQQQSSTAWILHKDHRHAGGKHSRGSKHAGHHHAHNKHRGGEEDPSQYHHPHHHDQAPHEPHYHHHHHAAEGPHYSGPEHEHHYWDSYFPQGPNHYGADEPREYPDPEYYPHEEEQYDYYPHGREQYDSYDSGPGSYGPPRQLCLQELSRTTNDFVLGTSGDWPQFTSYFGCCATDYDDTPSVVGYCTLTARQILTPPIVDAQVGKVSGTCKFTAPGPCVPPRMLNQEFTLSTLENQSFWLEVDSELRSNSSSGDYEDYGAAPYAVSTGAGAGSSSSSTAAAAAAAGAQAAGVQPAAVKPAYGPGPGAEYEYGPRDDPEDGPTGGPWEHDPTGGPPELLGRGKASVFTAMIASKAGLLKGGTFEFIAGFVDDEGEVLCPEGANPSTVSAPSVQSVTALPRVTCGAYKVKLWFAPGDHSYRGYDGTYQDPADVYYQERPPYFYDGPEY